MTIPDKLKSSKLISNSTFSAKMLEAQDYNKWILAYYDSYIEDNLLEIGLGHGAFYEYLPKRVRRYVGMDIDKDLVNHSLSLYPQNHYYQADLACDGFLDIHQSKFDAILCFNVLEHIEDDEKALRNMIDSLSQTGRILLFVPAFQSLYIDLDRFAGHHRRYTIADIRKLCQTCNGDIKESSYFNFLGGLGWWLNKFMNHDSLNDTAVNWQIRIFNKIILPFSKLIQPLTKKIFGQSLYVVIGRKLS